MANGMNLNHCCYLLLILAAIGSLCLPSPLVMWLLFANILTLMVYAVDKMAARRSWRRVPEFTLLVFGVVGGWPGAILGQQIFRHKTQKQPFKTYFTLSMVVNLVLVYVLFTQVQ